MSQAPPSQNRAPELEHTPDGRLIKRTRFGPFVEHDDGMFEAYVPPELPAVTSC